ncbi:pantetheine-phosphate adenylyltransferase [Sporomusaceae bacterium BoRhaA]|uniref:pantetheine-phosphate adenylyltransferase n=1 Tax=Pelorhabdus rhamnosifermentans TaxID=2772457 RepID=UPI001C062122|nr:pantetheine-phosphate adenylyltransferase [Pelorhabdus rhamnosifermentans]MBU2701088.1 pantetheine-phosphate adenylyltransferase [Pelorhabdus rhamnosifermentans]
MRIGVCAGSFDPVTNGHVDIFERASKMFDQLIVAVFHNPGKKPLFTMEERVDLLRLATSHIDNVRVDGFSGLLTDYVKKQNATVIVRGLRALSDFEYEFQRALLIKKIEPELETVFMMTSSDYSFVSSSGIKELARFDGPITGLVPACIEPSIIQRIRTER